MTGFLNSTPAMDTFIFSFIEYHPFRIKHRTVLADVLVTDIAASALADTAFHTQFHCGIDLFFLEAQFFQPVQCELDHDRRSADQNSTVQVRLQFLDIVRNKANVTVPALLFTVDGQLPLAVLTP